MDRMSVSTPDRPVSNRREATRRRLFEAAVTLISEQGYGATTVDEIAERAGVAKGTVYYNFGGKSELYTALMEWGITRLADTLKEAAPDPDADPAEALTAVLRAGVEFIGAHEALARLLMAEAWRTNRTWYTTVRQIRTEAIGVVTARLDALAAIGRLRPDLDTGLAGSALFGMVVTVALDWRTLQPDRPAEEVHATLTRMVHGLLGTSDSPADP
ncbi:TetR/AcrR family transcriptional regulator [Nocardiopsis sp. NPDC006139]|uniref:TetR/AcrR family transcriptional regulator n=2 Tax=Nocardiopsidaceae TaxID=83676 RepID=A0ABX8BHV5_9ACTN|nr:MULTISPECIES: TetR/AcrR family transcriptional regulator [Nocardiopsis]QUX21814.1 TetR/AcrR family transcriptional regulator [Nocardiopsis changdeensis]QYX37749.1 TetR/AcrR family transcriptional regulator [Nocardiopsis sp. MT53]